MHAWMMLGKWKIPFKNKGEGSESDRGDGITVDDEHVMAHTLLYSIHGKYEHASRSKLNSQ